MLYFHIFRIGLEALLYFLFENTPFFFDKAKYLTLVNVNQ